MDIFECYGFATRHPVCTLATIEGDQARVRTVMLWRADEQGFRVILGGQKSVTEQIRKNPKVELCFYNNCSDGHPPCQLRVSGVMQEITDGLVLEKARRVKYYLVGKTVTGEEKTIVVFNIAHGRAKVWKLEDVMQDQISAELTF